MKSGSWRRQLKTHAKHIRSRVNRKAFQTLDIREDDGPLKRAGKKLGRNIIQKNYIRNMPSDVLGACITRLPPYAIFDNVVVGVPDENVINSMANAFTVSILGWNFVYMVGHSVLAEALGPTYEKHKKKIDAIYSGTLTFGFGMGVNLAGGYSMREALAASSARAVIGLFLGTPTRWAADSLRDMKDQPVLVRHTRFQNKPLSYNLPRFALMASIPAAATFGTLYLTPDKPTLETAPLERSRYEAPALTSKHPMEDLVTFA